LLDDHLFHDGIHPSLRGQIALAQAGSWSCTIAKPSAGLNRFRRLFSIRPDAQSISA